LNHSVPVDKTLGTTLPRYGKSTFSIEVFCAKVVDSINVGLHTLMVIQVFETNRKRVYDKGMEYKNGQNESVDRWRERLVERYQGTERVGMMFHSAETRRVNVTIG
jgi:hypothetical protein